MYFTKSLVFCGCQSPIQTPFSVRDSFLPKRAFSPNVSFTLQDSSTKVEVNIEKIKKMKLKFSKIIDRCTHPVWLKKVFNWSHLSIERHPLENPNKPSSFLKKPGQLLTSPTLYTTLSCNEPPTLILKGLNAESN